MKKLYTTFAFVLLSGIIFAQLRIYTPQLTAPDNGATGLPPAAILDWNAVTGGALDVTYQVMLDKSPDFSNPTVVNTDITSYKTNNLLFNTWYYWKVRAWDATDTSSWTPVRTFKVLNTVILDNPNNNADEQDPNQIIEWDSIPGVTKYQVQYDTTYYLTEIDVPFTELLNDVQLINENLGWLAGESGTVGKYENGTWSTVDIGTGTNLFDIHFYEENRGAVSGDDGTVFMYDGTEWTDMSIADESDAVIAIWLTADGGYAATDAGNIYSYDGSSWTLFYEASVELFDIEFNNEMGFAVGAEGSLHYYDGTQWIDQSIEDADDLFSIEILADNNVWVAGGSGEFYHFNGTEWMQAPSTEEDDVFSLEMVDENLGYAIGESFYIYDGQVWNVSTTGVDAEFFGFSIADNGTGYAVGEDGIVLNYGSEGFNSPFAETITFTSLAPEYQLSQLPFGSEIFWRMRAIHPEDTSGWSAVGNFTTFDYITLSGPLSGTEQGLLVKLKWKEKDGVNGYQIEIANNDNFNNPEFYFIDSASIFLNELGFGETYYWRGRAVHNQDTSKWSETWNFNTIDEVYLTSPADGATEVTILPSLRWDKIVNVPRYQVQLSDSPDFDTLYYNDIAKDTNAFQVINKLDHLTEYYWRVRAIIIEPDTSGWSDVFSFTTIQPAGIEEGNNFAENLSFYPNPGNGNLTLEYSGEQAELKLKVIDLLGKVIVERSIPFNSLQNRQNINLQHLPEGTYLIRLEKNNEILTRKLIIRK